MEQLCVNMYCSSSFWPSVSPPVHCTGMFPVCYENHFMLCHRFCMSTQSVTADVVWSHCAGLQELKELHLDRTLVTDVGAAIVKGLTIFSIQ